MQDDFKNSLRVSPEYVKKTADRIKKIIAINEKYFSKEYRDLYKNHFLNEFLELKSAFPEIDFDYLGRFKNKESMIEKINRKINDEQKTGNVYDNFANKIIVYSVNGDTDEVLLRNSCNRILDFLVTYRSNLSGEYFEELIDKRKNYIEIPKPNGYQAIHLIRKHVNENAPDFLSETQIRTFRMEEQQKFGNSSHANNYKKGKTITLSRCPIFLKISRSKKTGLYKAHELTLEESYNEYKSYINSSSNKKERA